MLACVRVFAKDHAWGFKITELIKKCKRSFQSFQMIIRWQGSFYTHVENQVG